MQTSNIQTPKHLTYKQALKINPKLELGNYGIYLLHVEGQTPRMKQIKAEMEARSADPAFQLSVLECAMGGVKIQAQEMLNHSDPDIRAKAAKQVRDFIVRMWEIAEFDSI